MKQIEDSDDKFKISQLINPRLRNDIFFVIIIISHIILILIYVLITNLSIEIKKNISFPRQILYKHKNILDTPRENSIFFDPIKKTIIFFISQTYLI